MMLQSEWLQIVMVAISAASSAGAGAVAAVRAWARRYDERLAYLGQDLGRVRAETDRAHARIDSVQLHVGAGR